MGNHCSSKQAEKENKTLESGSQQIQAQSQHAPAGSDKGEKGTEGPTNHIPDKVEPESSIQLSSQKVLCQNKSPEVKAKIISFNIRYKNPFMEEERQLRRQKLDQDRKMAKSAIRSKKKTRRKLVCEGALGSFHKPVTGKRRQRNLKKIYARSAQNLYYSGSSDSILESSGGSSCASRRSRRSTYNNSKRKSRNESWSEGALVEESARLYKSRRRQRRCRTYARTHRTLPGVRDASSGSNDNSSIIPLVNEPLVHVLNPLPQEEQIKESQENNQTNILAKPSAEDFSDYNGEGKLSRQQDLKSSQKNGSLCKESSPEEFDESSRQASPASKEAAPMVPPSTIAGNGCLSRAKSPSAPPPPEPAQQQAQAEDSELKSSAELNSSQVSSQSQGSAPEKVVSSTQAQQGQAAEEEDNETKLKGDACAEK